MKTVNIKGKHNINMINGEKNTTRATIKDNITHYLLQHKDQIKLINQIYLKSHIIDENIIMRELDKKISGYKNQDIKKNIYNEQLLISKDEVIEKLVLSKLKCYFCRCNVEILYTNVREKNQWTLDRINNDDCHSNINTVIACLKCNLDRRVTNIDKFKFTKQLIIKKINIKEDDLYSVSNADDD